jgi:hypothetical protein
MPAEHATLRFCSSSKDAIFARNSKASVALEFLTKVRVRICNLTQTVAINCTTALNSSFEIIEKFSDC